MNAHDAELRRRTVRSLFWQFLGVGGQRVVQLLQPMVVARQIPEGDIGLFVIVLTGIGVVESLTLFMGEQTTISSQSHADRNYLNTVFTVRLVRSFAISSMLCALAWPLAWFFTTPETASRYWLPGLFLTLAGNGVLDALQSPARAAHMKGLEFRRIVLGDFLATVLGVSVTIALAVVWQNVWAMLLGHLAGTLIRSGVSYWSAPHVPRWCLDRTVLKELFQYNRSAAGAPFLLLLIFTAPTFVLGKVLANDAALAIFDFAGRLAKLPEDIFLRVLAPVAIPAYAQLRGDRERLGRAWLSAVHAFLLVGTPLTVGLAWCGDDMPAVVFGRSYGELHGLFALQSLHGGLAGLTAVVGPLFWAVGEPQWDRRAQFYRCLAIYGLGIPAALWGGVQGFAAATCAAIGLGLLLSVRYALRYLDLRVLDLTRAARDGLLVGTAMLAPLLIADACWHLRGMWRLLAAGICCGPVIATLVALQLKGKRQVAVPAEEPPPGLDDHTL